MAGFLLFDLQRKAGFIQIKINATDQFIVKMGNRLGIRNPEGWEFGGVYEGDISLCNDAGSRLANHHYLKNGLVFHVSWSWV